MLPPTYFLGALVLAIVLDLLAPIAAIVPYPWNLIGAVPIAIGIWLNLAADRALKVHHTTVKPFEDSTALVTDGVFGLSRNPMYLGMVLILLGAAVLLGTVSPFAVTGALWIVLDRRFVVTEEQMMSHMFESEWERYRARVRKWI